MPVAARITARTLGSLLLGLALLSCLYGLYQFTLGEPLLFADLGHFWYRRSPTSLQLLQPAIERHIAAWLWDPVMLAILTTPTWIVIGGVAAATGLLGAVLVAIGGKQPPRTA
jgi:hypothetical protein